MDWKFSLALRHLSGAQSRKAVKWMNVFAFAGLALSVFAWLTVTSVMTGMQNQIKDRVLQHKPHVIWEGRPRKDASLVKQNIQSFFNDREGLEFLELTLRSEALVEFVVPSSGRSRQSGGVVEGVDDLGVVGGVSEGGVKVPSSIANKLSVMKGDTIKLRSAWNLQGFPLKLIVSEVYDDHGSGDIVSPILVSRSRLSRWLELDNSFSWVALRLDDPDLAPLIAKEMSERLSIPFKSWQSVDSALWYSLRLEKTVMSLAVLFVLILSSFALYMAISVRLAEKLKELAVLRALGAESADLRKLFLIQGMTIGFVGGMVGILLSFGACYSLENLISLPSFYYSTNVPVDWQWSRAFYSLGAVAILSFLSTLFPIHRALNFSISETLRS